MGITIRRITCHRLLHDAREIARRSRHERFEGSRRSTLHLAQHVGGIATGIWGRPRDHLIEDGAECVDVRRLVDSLAARLLGRHVSGRANDGAYVREVLTGSSFVAIWPDGG